VGEEDIVIRIDNETEWTALECACGVLQSWLQFFQRHGIQIK